MLALHFAILLAAVTVNGSYIYEEKRPYYMPIYPQYQNTYYYEPGFQHTYGGIAAPYRNDERQQHVNNEAYTYGSGLGTAPWYGVPGTGYDFTHSYQPPAYGHQQQQGYGSSGGNNYGYHQPITPRQYYSQPSYHQPSYGHGNSYGHDSGYGSSHGHGQGNSYGNSHGGQGNDHGSSGGYGGHDGGYGHSSNGYDMGNSYDGGKSNSKNGGHHYY